jgi:hypothetical protein
MGTLGPTGTTADASTFANFATWAGNGTFGINTALTNFGWTRTSDPNQVNWAASPSAPPASGSAYPFSLQPSATYNGVVVRPSYSVNCRGTWVSGTTYNYLDVVTSPTTGASYLLARNFYFTNVSVASGTATITASNNLAAGGGDKVKFTLVSAANFLLGQTFTTISATSTSFTINVAPLGVTTYGSTGDYGVCGIQLSGSTDPSSDTTNYIVYHYEMWQSNDSQSFAVTNVARTAGGLATFTCANRFKAGFNVVVSGLSNVPALNGTWCVASATPTAFTVQTGGGSITSTGDSGTAVYTFQPMMLKLEYWGNTSPYSTAPWVRVSFGMGGTDGVGNLIGNFVGSNNMAFNLTNSGFLFCDLRPSSTTPSGSQTSSIWQCAASGASPTGTNTVGNCGRFGVSLWYNRNDTFAANNGSVFWVVERSYNDSGYATDDYMTYVVGCLGNAGVFAAATTEVQQRSIMKPNPTATVTQVQVTSNQVTITYSPSLSGYQFAVGAIVYVSNMQNATFLDDQFLQVTSVGANSITASFTNANYGPLGDSGKLTLTTSLTAVVPIAGTGLPCLSDPRANCPYTSQGSLAVNFNVPLLCVFPILGFVGNPMTIGQSVKSGDQLTHDQTFAVTFYGVTMHYYNLQGSTTTDPYAAFGGQNSTFGGARTNGFMLRWD